MNNELIALISSFIAVGFVIAAYFTKSKMLYLFFQCLNIICLAISYFFSGEFFAMVGISVSFARTLTFFMYEKKGKTAPWSLAYLFAAATVVSYFLVNFVVLKISKPLDILCVVGLVMNTFIFKIENLKTLRFSMLLPLSILIVYNALCAATIFVVISYSIELLADIISIFKYHIFSKREKH